MNGPRAAPGTGTPALPPKVATAAKLPAFGARSPRGEARRSAVERYTALALGGDALTVMGVMALAFWVRLESGWIPRFERVSAPPADMGAYAGHVLTGVLVAMALLSYCGCYCPNRFFEKRQLRVGIMKASLLWLVVFLAVSVLLKTEPDISRIFVAIAFAILGPALLAWRWLLALALARGTIGDALRRRLLLVGWSDQAADLLKGNTLRAAGFEVVGYVPGSQARIGPPPPKEVLRLGSFRDLDGLLTEHRVDAVLLAETSASAMEVAAVSTLCERRIVEFLMVPTFIQVFLSNLTLDIVGGVPVLAAAQLPLDRLPNRVLKRSVDIAGALVGLALSAPVVTAFALVLYLESPGPIFYSQVRAGRAGRLFRMLKIRSMRVDAEAETGAKWTEVDDPRRLRVGTVMRRWNVDEIPQFWNVFTGEMSLVGPRPERPELIEKFMDDIPHYNARHLAKPGMTGWAQVNGFRGDTCLRSRIQHDVYYLEHWSILFDFYIMVLTFVRRENAY